MGERESGARVSNSSEEPDVRNQLILAGLVAVATLGASVGAVVFPWLFVTFLAEHFFDGSRYNRAYHSQADKGPLAQALVGIICFGVPGMVCLGAVWIARMKIEFRSTRMTVGAYLTAFFIGLIVLGVINTLLIVAMSRIG